MFKEEEKKFKWIQPMGNFITRCPTNVGTAPCTSGRSTTRDNQWETKGVWVFIKQMEAPSKKHGIAFGAVANIVQVQIEKEGTTFGVQYDDNQIQPTEPRQRRSHQNT